MSSRPARGTSVAQLAVMFDRGLSLVSIAHTARIACLQMNDQ